MEIPRQLSLLLSQKTALYKLTMGPSCQEQHPHYSHCTARSRGGAYMDFSIQRSSVFGDGKYSPGATEREMLTNNSATKSLT